ncbi:MAG: hypothetical protein QOJ29_4645, partial [Thermoleophilaceae bacterium]|nr:hypothetical protein [Thermoleophilaceae bacterium]
GPLDGPAGARDRIDASVEGLVGGSGGDVLIGGPSDNVLDGGPGPDRLTGGAGEDAADYTSRTEGVRLTDNGQTTSGSDVDGPASQRDGIDPDVEDLWGGDGNDVLIGNGDSNLLDGGHGADQLQGGAGEDAADYSERTTGVFAALDGQPNSGNDEDGPPGARDTLATDIEALFGGSGPDELHGSSGRNYVAGQGGDDLIDVRDKGADYADCGEGNDIGWVAPDDIPASDCERIGNGPDPTGPSGVTDKTPAQIRVSLLGKRQTRASVLGQGLNIHFTCSETCNLDARLFLRGADARQLGIKLGPKRILIGRTPARRDGAGQGNFTLTIIPRVVSAATHASRLSALLTVFARDAAGNRTRVVARLVVGGGKVRLGRV